MKLYIQTPLFKNAKGIPHMVEHCIGKSRFLKSDFFSFTYGIDAEITANFTCYAYDDWIDSRAMIEYLTQSLEKSAFDFELPVIVEECEETSYNQRIYESSLSILLQEQYDLNSASNLSWESVDTYHKKYYQSKYMLICDDNYQLIFQGSGLKKKLNQVSSDLWRHNFVFEEDDYILLGYKKASVKDFWKLFFVQTLIEGFIFAEKRRKEGEYYHGTPYFFSYSPAVWILIPDYDFSSYTKDFFDQGKCYCLQMLKAGYFKQTFFLNTYLYGMDASRESVVSWIEALEWTEFYEQILSPLLLKK